MHDIVIHGGELVDPRSKTRHRRDIGLRGGFIAEIGENLQGRERIDARGLAVTPGFIDPHCHNEGITTYRNTLDCSKQSLAQGVTTMINGNCGASVQDVGAYLKRIPGTEVNVGEYIGASTLRRMVGLLDIYRPADENELSQMCALAEEALLQGACGISFGLGYVPGTPIEEAIALAKVAGKYRRIVSIDTRMESETDLNSLADAIRISREGNVRVLVSHFVYQYGEGVISEALEMMRTARSEGVDIFADSGMYTWWATGMGADLFRESYLRAHPGLINCILVATGEHSGEYLDWDLYAHMRSVHPGETVICKTGDKQSIYDALLPDFVMPSSDTAPYPKGEGHPQIAASFARYFKKVRTKKLYSMEEAVYRATLLPAQVFNIPDRGTLDIGARADLVVLDLQNVADQARFSDMGRPDLPPVGIDTVLVNGRTVLHQGQWRALDAGLPILW